MPATAQLTQVEKDKLDIDPDFDFRKIAETPFADLTPNEIAMFKWWGVYHQLQPTFFMIRLVTPGGLMTTRQFRRAVALAEQFAQGELCITTRQTLQYHWVRQQDIHKVLEGMAEVGITTKNGCGDVTRNLVTCSLQGVCPHEEADYVRDFILRTANDPEIRDRQRNLPRKHKISVAGCGRACAQTLMNCQGWVPVPGEKENGWKFYAGGGLGARPYLAKKVFDWVPDALALPVAQATLEAFNRHGDRRNRAFARLKIVVDRLGAEAFGKLVVDIMRERGIGNLDAIRPAADPAPRIGRMFLDGQEAIAQKQPGLSTVRVMIPRSELKTGQSLAIAGWAERFGNGEIMFTNRQNVEIRHVETGRVDELLRHIAAAGFRTAGHERLPDVVACVGTTVCRMAAGDTPLAYRRIMEELADDTGLWQAVGPLRVNLTGCPNNCAHAWIADIGLRGRRIRRPDGGSADGFDIYVGGKISEAGRIACCIGSVPGETVAPAIRRILDFYLARRRSEAERFTDFCERVPIEVFTEALTTETA